MFLKKTSLHGFTGGFVYMDGNGYNRFYHWTRKGDHLDTFMQFINDVGVPTPVISNNAIEELMGKSRQTNQKYRIRQKTVQSLAECSRS
jgi:hypothetical protein